LNQTSTDLGIQNESRPQGFGIIPLSSSFMSAHEVEIAAIATRHRVPAISYSRAFAEAGGLASYGNDQTDNWRRAAAYVDRILKGENPSELPVQFPIKFELVIKRLTQSR
jgi:putative ABC transport system substrate-binding protein